MATATDAGLWKRGLLLLALVGILAAVVLYAALHREPESVAEADKPGPIVLAIGAPAAELPLAISWGALLQVGEMLPSPPGWETRYNATLALARRGSAAVRLEVLGEMLDEHRQMRNFRTQLEDGREVVDQAAARQTILNALKAVRDWHQHPKAVRAVGPDNPELQRVYAAIDRLTDSPDRLLSTEAASTRDALKRG
jgi:hypothetical protein